MARSIHCNRWLGGTRNEGKTMVEPRTAESYAEEAAELRSNLRNARAERDMLRKDAERYRWLRERFDACAAFMEFNPVDAGISDWQKVDQNRGAGIALDAAIDAAMVAR